VPAGVVRFTEKEITDLMDGNARRLLAAIPEASGSGLR